MWRHSSTCIGLPISMDISSRKAGSGAPNEFANAWRKVRSSAAAMFVVDGSADYDWPDGSSHPILTPPRDAIYHPNTLLHLISCHFIINYCTFTAKLNMRCFFFNILHCNCKDASPLFLILVLIVTVTLAYGRWLKATHLILPIR